MIYWKDDNVKLNDSNTFHNLEEMALKCPNLREAIVEQMKRIVTVNCIMNKKYSPKEDAIMKQYANLYKGGFTINQVVESTGVNEREFSNYLNEHWIVRTPAQSRVLKKE